MMNEWLGQALQKDVVVRGAKVAAAVGTLLVAINYADVILAGDLRPLMVGKILLTYCVPYCVSTFASVEAVRTFK